MGKLIESTFVTLDGVISHPERWGSPYWDDEHTSYATKMLFEADALLLLTGGDATGRDRPDLRRSRARRLRR